MRNYIISLLLSGFFISCGFFGAGSYPNAEQYSIELSRRELIEKIDSLKKNYPEFRTGYSDHFGDTFYTFYFYLEDKEATVHCVFYLNEDQDEKPTRIILTGISYDKIKSWKSINTKDLSKEENNEIKKQFETVILDKLGKWEHKWW